MKFFDRIFGRKSIGTQSPPWLRSGGSFVAWPYPERRSVQPHESLAASAAVRRIADLYLEAELVAERNGNRLAGYPALDLLAEPNPFTTGDQLSELIVWSLVADGNAYLLVSPDRSIYWLDHRRVEPATSDPRSLIERYEYRESATALRVIPLDAIIHLRRGCDPTNPAKGFSPLKTIATDLELESAASEYGATVLANMGVPSVALAPKQGEAVLPTPEQSTQIKLRWQSETAGRNRGNVVVLPFPTEITELQISPDAMNPGGLLEQATDRICAAVGIDPMVVGLPSSRQTYSNYEQALDAAVRQVVVPLQESVASQLTVQLVRRVFKDEAVNLAWDRSSVSALQDDATKLRESASKLYTSGIATLNEARAICGLPPVKDGNRFNIGNGTWR